MAARYSRNDLLALCDPRRFAIGIVSIGVRDFHLLRSTISVPPRRHADEKGGICSLAFGVVALAGASRATSL